MSDKHTTVQYQLRLPEELRNTIRESAKNHNTHRNQMSECKVSKNLLLNNRI